MCGSGTGGGGGEEGAGVPPNFMLTRRSDLRFSSLFFSVSVALGFGILINVSSPRHDSRCVCEILFEFQYLREAFTY